MTRLGGPAVQQRPGHGQDDSPGVGRTGPPSRPASSAQVDNASVGAREIILAGVQTAGLAGALVGAAYLVVALGGRRYHVAGLAVLAPLVVLGAHLLWHLRWPPSTAKPVPPRPHAPPAERSFSRFDSVDLRLRSALEGNSVQYESAIHPILVKLAADRLRRRHGIDLDEDPSAARRLTGEGLWSLLCDASPRRPPNIKALREAINVIERL